MQKESAKETHTHTRRERLTFQFCDHNRLHFIQVFFSWFWLDLLSDLFRGIKLHTRPHWFVTSLRLNSKRNFIGPRECYVTCGRLAVHMICHMMPWMCCNAVRISLELLWLMHIVRSVFSMSIFVNANN